MLFKSVSTPAFFASCFCAVLAAQGSLQVSAAVPVEESVQASSQSSSSQRGYGGASSRRALDIPPTIEPGAPSSQPRPVAGVQSAPPGLNADSVAPDTADAGQLGQIFYQVQLLQQEVQELRGQVEQQDYLIKRLQRDQKEQYLDLDQRVVALYNNKPAPAPSTSIPKRTAPRAGGGSLSERDAYEAAFDAMRNREFEESLFGFRQLIENYPNGQYTPNAYYWIGELHLAAQSEPEQARQSFMQVVNLYPDHQKTPDALYKLGVVYHSLGDTQRALEYLDRVQQQYPGSSAAGLAAKFAAELQ